MSEIHTAYERPLRYHAIRQCFIVELDGCLFMIVATPSLERFG